ncbi:MAG: hypothetical protein ACM3JG_06265 [Thiohalocapsa sp.]
MLEAVFGYYGTDKVAYATAYEVLLRPRRHRVTTVLEIGIGTLIPTASSNMVGWAARHYQPGGSLRAWRDYFPAARVIGIDVQPDTQFTEERISTYLCDSTDQAAVGRLVRQLGLHDVDLIVDDGSHLARDQLSTLRNLFHLLAPDGLYVIEDVVGNDIFKLKDEILRTVGNSVLLSAGVEFNPIFIQKVV